MNWLKTHFRNFEKITMLVIFFSIFLSGCVQSSKNKRTTAKSSSSSTTDKNATTTLPTFTTSTNFIQNGGSVYLSNVTIDLNFSDTMQLRGKEVDAYIRANSTTTTLCIATYFSHAAVNRVIVLAANPKSVYNFQTQATEYYFNLTPGDGSFNQSFCQKTGLINKLAALYPGVAAKFKMSDVCVSGSCPAIAYASKPLDLYNTSGTVLSQVATKHLVFNVTNTTNGGSSSGQSCTDSTQCVNQGYDCCSSGQCVKDLALKPNAENLAGYPQVLQDILNNPANVYLYPDYFFICSEPVNTPTTPTTPVDPISEANLRVTELERLYNCSNKIEGEYGVCTYVKKSATTNVEYEIDADDRNFKGTFTHRDPLVEKTLLAIEQISYGGVVIYDYTTKSENDIGLEPYTHANVVKIVGAHNDDVTNGTKITILQKPATATSDELVVKYKVDASCVKVNPLLAKCEKYYIQDQGYDDASMTDKVKRQRRLTNHYTPTIPLANNFKIPEYADTTKSITVKLDGVIQKQDIDWELVTGTTPASVQFLPANTLKVFKDQKIVISYFVNYQVHKVMESKLKAQTAINAKCSCSTSMICGLSPVKNSANQIVDYACVYPDDTPVEVPATQKIYLSSKAVPMRFFDSAGTSKKTVTSSDSQETKSTPFAYTKDDLSKPNNLDGYVGMSEIYGSLNYTNNSAKPASEVNVKKGTTYNIYVDRGSYSNCTLCGNDYYSQLNKLFPLTQFGGGVIPLIGQTNRTMSAGIRADDLKFGRACLVPATMLPWSHAPDLTSQDQRLNRMTTQHFLYANGYQYDWYGFDYGSVIGSFDGVKWFSIGTNRQIKAETSKMFIAVNGIFGDLAVDTTYEVTVSDSTLNPVSTNIPTTDYASDGAQCQQFHQCSTDNDCATTLGWEYACAPISEITTPWPVFDENAKEIPEASRDDNRFTSILGISSANKRCVYRGRGALCTPSYDSINLNSTFSQTTNQTLHSCSANTHCQTISTNGNLAQKFNSKIARYGKVLVDSTTDTFGLAAILPGRPFAYHGSEIPQSDAAQNLSLNKVSGLCLPGRDIERHTFLEQNQLAPSENGDFNGDKVLGIGMTHKLNTPIAEPEYLLSCSIMDSGKNYYHNSTATPSAPFSGYSNLKYDSGAQAMATNALHIFNSIFSAKGLTFGLLKNNSPSTKLTTTSFNEDRCMRAPGAGCFTDLECAPSKIISDKVKALNAEDATVTAILNKYEVKFWQEELVCGQAIAKTSNLYDPKNNRCCRALGNTISLPSADISNGLDMTKVPGIDMPISTKNRYSRAATMYKETNLASSNFPELRTAIKDQCNLTTCASTATLANQFRTFAAFAEKTSCSGDWVRNFATGNHKWEVARLQTFPANTFRCMNWYPGTGGYTCSGYDLDDPNCPIAQTPQNSVKAKEVFSYLGRLELMGIPQIALENPDYFKGNVENGLSCKSDPSNRANTAYPTPNYLPPNDFFKAGTVHSEYEDGTKNMLSAIDPDNFKSMKQVFKPDEVVSCLAAGTQMKAGDDPALCCTGTINGVTQKCQLNDFIDISVYTNRYVSSEGKNFSPTLFDQYGYLKDPGYAATLACEKQMCASGYVAFGILVSRLKTPGHEDAENKYFRFMEGATADDQSGLLSLYNKGLKINSHAYCLPEEVATSVQNSNSTDLTIYKCN